MRPSDVPPRRPRPGRRAAEPPPAGRPARGDRPPFALVVTFALLVLYTGRMGRGVADLALVVLLVQALRPDMAIPRHPAVAAVAVVAAIVAVQVGVELLEGTDDPGMIVTNLGAVYGAGFAFAVYALMRRWEASAGRAAVEQRLRRAVDRVVPAVVVALALLALRLVLLPDLGAGLPAAVQPIVYVSTAVVAPTLAFVLPVLAGAGRDTLAARWRRPLVATWLLAFAVFAFEGRAVALGVGIGLAVTHLRPARLLRVAYGVLVVLVALWATGLSIGVGEREVSFDQAVEAARSVVSSESDEEDADLYRTKEWRTEWWAEIVEDVRSEPFVLRGHGWDVSLGDRYGMNDARRELGLDLPPIVFPHNLFLTLAGLGGVVLAVMFLAVPVLTLARRRSGGGALATGARAAVVAALVVSMTGVLIEGSSGGSFFWVMVGLLWWFDAAPVQPGERAGVTGGTV